MKAELKKYLFDIKEAACNIEDFVKGMEYSDYKGNALAQAAVERKFGIIGEALKRIKETDLEFIENIPEYDRIIGFRNILVHGYDVIDHEIVWAAIEKHLPKLKLKIVELLNT